MSSIVSPAVVNDVKTRLATDLKEYYVEAEGKFTDIIAALYDDDKALEVGGFSFEGEEKESSAANLALNIELQNYENVYGFGLNVLNMFVDWDKQMGNIIAAG